MKARASIPRVSLHIETLLLDGFAPGERYRIGAAMQRELERLFSTQVPPLRQGEIARLDGGEFQVGPSANADAVGSKIAQAVYGGLKQ